jgi:hypothetical protein
MIRSTKSHENGFKRETIINIGDTLILAKTFETLREKRTDNDYELLETVDYLGYNADIVRLMRRAYPATLADTIEFRQMKLEAYDGNVNFIFSDGVGICSENNESQRRN